MREYKLKFLKRLIVAVIFIPLLLFIAYSENQLFSFIFSIIVITGSIFEIYRIFRIKLGFYYIFTFLLAFSNLFYIYKNKEFNPFFLIILAGFMLIYEVFLYNKREKRDFKRLLIIFFSNIYINLFFSYFLLMKVKFFDSSKFALLFFISVWVIDSSAYFVGMTLAKKEHRGVMKVSGKKSIEGFLAGIIIPTILFVFFRGMFYLNILHAIGFMVAFSVAVQLGDLTQSLIKRYADVKDSSSLIAGHGGIFDRFDSMIFSMPFFYLLVRLIYSF
ncbi:MAG: hypothetical protein FXF47_08150 [Candidatus Mcinerneyibacterium aminivorans]|uniref:Phosphatidate cytidylyltransferase n=1 Tax=Candidatus Mcinerneyibacterium aminivorans TaxID=2703815 RepID=A0A5D0MAG2_9BACT|nr:MAG: hypothetical protein FXF47_08150 [Candidatus Mcinerneyibacterium aminivorans]